MSDVSDLSGSHPKGERVLAWAQRVLADYGGLTQELSELREGLAGQLRIGAIPVSLPALALLTAPFSAIHAKTRFQVISQTSIEIQRELDDFTIDVGLTYLDNDPLSRVRTVPLYRERYVLVTHEASGFSGLKSHQLGESGDAAPVPSDPIDAEPPDYRRTVSGCGGRKSTLSWRRTRW